MPVVGGVGVTDTVRRKAGRMDICGGCVKTLLSYAGRYNPAPCNYLTPHGSCGVKEFAYTSDRL